MSDYDEAVTPERQAAASRVDRLPAVAAAGWRNWPVGEISEIDPLGDDRWGRFVKLHPQSSVFHTPQWLDAIRRTYGFRPTVFSTATPEGELDNAIVFCRVKSWLTGNRLVSLPFSDHCEPLVGSPTALAGILTHVGQKLADEKLHYLEIRPRCNMVYAGPVARSTTRYCCHTLDLSPSVETLFHNCHKSSTQRKIARAEREQLVIEAGRSGRLLNSFYQLLEVTRQRHHLPPQPRIWFRNLIDCFGENLEIRVAYKERQPLAAILTITHKNTLVYKYGCSDARFHNLGAMQSLFWRAITDAKSLGLASLDFGRSDLANPGLIIFKDRWGTERSTLVYTRLATSEAITDRYGFRPAGRTERMVREILPRLPNIVQRAVGDFLYKHVA